MPRGRHRGSTLAPAAAAAPVLLAGCAGPQSVLDPAGPAADRLALLWWTLFACLGVLTLAVLATLVLAFRARRDDGVPQRARLERRLVIGGGLVLPLVVATVLMTLNVATGAAVPGHSGKPLTLDEPEIEVIGHQFWWEVRYPATGAVTANEIHIPTGRPVTLRLSSVDVIHSFWVPRLHGKIDMTPGHVTHVTLEADRPGEYRGQCAEFCGLQHALMAFLVIADPPAEYEAWLAREAAPADEPATEEQEQGHAVFLRDCAACHAIRGTEADGDVGPDLTHFARRRTLGAVRAVNNRGNLGGWVTNAQALKPGNLMPPIPLESNELLALLDYLESLE